MKENQNKKPWNKNKCCFSMTHETILDFPNKSQMFVNVYLENRRHTDLEPSPSWYEWKMKEKQLIKASWSDFVICSIHVNVTSKQQQHMCAERAMGFGRQQRLNAADTDKYSHFEEAKCTFIGTKLVEKMSRLRKTGHLLACSGHFILLPLDNTAS